MKTSIFNYELFNLTSEDIKRLEASQKPEDINTLGLWYIVTFPVKDAAERAESCFRKAIEKGYTASKLHLANMYRLGDLGKVDMNEYFRLRDEAVSEGCQLAEMRLCKDVAYGVGQTENLAEGLSEAMKRCSYQRDADPRWYDTIGWMLLGQGEDKQAETWFRKAVDEGFVDSYMGFMESLELQEEGRRAGCGGCCLFIAEELKKKYDECARNDSNAVECFSDDYEKKKYLDANYKQREELAAQIEELYVEAERKGESGAFLYHGKLYYDAEYHHMEDDEKAWALFSRGAELGHSLCMSMMADMIEEGRAPEEYHWEDACKLRLKSLRFGNEDELLDVVHCYFEDDYDEDDAYEIKTYYLPKYEALENEPYVGPNGEGLEDWPDDDPEDDDGRFDAWA